MLKRITVCLMAMGLTACAPVPANATPSTTSKNVPQAQEILGSSDTELLHRISRGILAMKAEVEESKRMLDLRSNDPGNVDVQMEYKSYALLKELIGLSEEIDADQITVAAALKFAERSQASVSLLGTINAGNEAGYFYEYSERILALYKTRK